MEVTLNAAHVILGAAGVAFFGWVIGFVAGWYCRR